MSVATLDQRTDLELAAQDLAPQIHALRDDIEAQRRLPSSLLAAMLNAGLFHMWVPRKFGGSEATPETFLRVVETVSRVDGAAGWCLMIGAGSGIFSGFLPEPAAEAIFSAKRRQVLAGNLGAAGRAIPVAGGYRLSGQWPFGSGIHHAGWVIGGAVIYDGDRPRLSAGGWPESRLFIFPAQDVTILDTWSVGGLRGTGSHDYRVENLFVPQERTLSFADAPTQPGPLYAFPTLSLLPPHLAAVALGIARGAIDALIEQARAQTTRQVGQPLRERALVQAAIAQAEARLESARAWLLETVNAAWRRVTAGDPLSIAERARLRLAATNASDSAAYAVDLIYRAGGASALYTANPLERAFRDIHAISQHVMVQPVQYEAVGRALLGLPAMAVPPL